MPQWSRRSILTASSAALAMSALPISIRRALAMPTARAASGTIGDVRHVVILTQENRSFDHYFGTLPGVRGFNDRFTIPQPDHRSVWQQTYDPALAPAHHTRPDASGQPRFIYPYALDGRHGNAQRAPNTNHGWEDGQAAWDNGRKTHWPTVKRPCSMAYYTREGLPFQFALAEAFTVCDAYHCSVNSSTHPNRIMMMTGNFDPKGLAGGPAIENEFDRMGPSSAGYGWETYPERLERAGISWKLYQNAPDFYEDNPLVGFRQYRRANELHGNATDGSPYPAYAEAHNAGNPLYKGVANTMPDGGLLQAFRDDIDRGALPQVSYIAAPEAYCEHGDPSSPIQGGWYAEQVLNALTAHAEIWQHTVFIVNYDENDGFFDHAVHPAAPSYNADGSLAGKSTVSTEDEYAGRFVVGLGARVPATIVSPWSRGGWINSQVFDHTSIIRFLERCFGVEEPSISAYRRAICGDLMSCFDFSAAVNAMPAGLRSPDKATVDAVRQAQEALAAIPVPSVEAQTPPRQENGIRPSRALPYQLHVTSEVFGRRAEIALEFNNVGSEAAVFHVYDRLRLDQIPRRYTVEAGKTVRDLWIMLTLSTHPSNEAHYDLWVLGPNGFHRAFVGSAHIGNAFTANNADIKVIYHPAENALTLQLRNVGVNSVAFSVTANAYLDRGLWRQVVSPNETHNLRWGLSESANWYDFTTRIDGDARFSRRFAGRMENGQSLTTDPAFQAMHSALS